MKEIETIWGNLLDFPPYCDSTDRYVGINCIAHSCNTLNIMGGGLAKQIKERFPQAWEADCKAHAEGKNILGSFSRAIFKTIFLKEGYGTIYNLYTQENIGNGRQVNYESLYRSFINLRKEITSLAKEKVFVLGLPYGISCGLAGGSWRIVNSMINEVFLGAVFETYIVKYDIGQLPRTDWEDSSFEYNYIND